MKVSSLYGRKRDDELMQSVISGIEAGKKISEIMSDTGLTRSNVNKYRDRYRWRKWSVKHGDDDLNIEREQFINAEWWGDIHRTIPMALARYGYYTKDDVLDLLETGDIFNISNIGSKKAAVLYRHFWKDKT